MAATVATVPALCNLALGFIGCRDYIDAMNEDSTEAESCSIFFPMALGVVLNKRCWRFATKRATLALTTQEREGWGYCYVAPADMLKPFEVWPAKRMPRADERNPFALELNDAGDGHLICTDMPEAVLRYTRSVAVGLYPPTFVEAVAWRLAVYLALALPVKPGLGLNLEQKANAAYRDAAADDLQHAQEDVDPESELFTIRQ